MLTSKVKICGITSIEDALFCSSCGAHALGLIFWDRSPRSVSLKSAKEIVRALDPFITKVGVFVDEPKEKVLEYIQTLGLDAVQLHGRERPPYCNAILPYAKVIKTFFAHEESFLNIDRYKVSAYLFDVHWEEKNKGQKNISKDFLKQIASLKEKKVILSGGLTPENVSRFIKKIKPYAADVASGVEAFPGKKDKQKVLAFIKSVQRTPIS